MSLIPPNPSSNSTVAEDVCTPEHCFHAFDALYCAVVKSAIPIPPLFEDEKYPLFVTINTRRPSSSVPGRYTPRLRGCIGNFEASPIREGIAEYALISAFKDHRFRPISREEVESGKLEIEVSLLTDFEDAASYLDWTIGIHGIRISFPHPASLAASNSNNPSPLSSSAYLPRMSGRTRTFSATFLPDVIPAQNWTKIEAVDSAIQKAGWNGAISEDLRRSIKLRRYQSRRCTVGWDEYIEWRKMRLAETAS